MVISYSIQELYAIGEMMTITELLARGKSGTGELECNSKFNTIDFIKTFQKLININHNLHSSVPDQNQQQTVVTTTSTSNNTSNSSDYNCNTGHHNDIVTGGFSGGGQEAPLTSSVAEFFKKAQQNFYPQANINPTKVRRLSEIEAELIGAIKRE